MSKADHFIELAEELLGRSATEHAKRSYKRRLRAFVKAAKVAGLMLGAAIVIPVGMITAGLLLGPRGYEGVIAAPLSVLLAWAGIVFFAYRAPATPRKIAKSTLPELPANTGAWLDHHRHALPPEAQSTLDSIALRLESLAPQVRAVDPNHPAAAALRRVLAEELPDLVSGYQKVPRALQKKPLHGGPSPDARLVEGLATLDAEIERAHTRLATDHLHELATQQRYLEIKYKSGNEN